MCIYTLTFIIFTKILYIEITLIVVILQYHILPHITNQWHPSSCQTAGETCSMWLLTAGRLLLDGELLRDLTSAGSRWRGGGCWPCYLWEPIAAVGLPRVFRQIIRIDQRWGEIGDHGKWLCRMCTEASEAATLALGNLRRWESGTRMQHFHSKNGHFMLVGGLEHILFSHILEIVIPIDFHIFKRGRYTTNQHGISLLLICQFRRGHCPVPTHAAAGTTTSSSQQCPGLLTLCPYRTDISAGWVG